LSSEIIAAWLNSLLLRSLQRALDRRLYLLLFGDAYGAPSGKPVWHFPEKVYESEETMRKVNILMWFFPSHVVFPFLFPISSSVVK